VTKQQWQQADSELAGSTKALLDQEGARINAGNDAG